MRRVLFSLILLLAFGQIGFGQSTTTNLTITKPQTGQAQPQVTIATGFDNFDTAVAGRLSKSVAGSSDVTLTTAEARNAIIECTGAITANINLIVPNKNKIYTIYNNTTGAFTLTVKTAAGTGIAVTQGTRVTLYCDATNVVSVGAAGGATAALDNLASVAINTSLIPATTDVIDLGSSTKFFRNGFLSSYSDWKRISAPSNPASGSLRLFANNTTGKLACLDSAGADCMPSGGGGSTGAKIQLSPMAAVGSTGFPAFVQTNGTNFPVVALAYDAATDETAYWTFRATGYTSGNLTLKILWYADTASSNDVVWAAAIAAITPNTDTQDVETKAFATANTATCSHLGTTGQRLHSCTVTISNLDSLAADDQVWIKIFRDADNGSDTMTGDALLIQAEISYNGFAGLWLLVGIWLALNKFFSRRKLRFAISLLVLLSLIAPTLPAAIRFDSSADSLSTGTNPGFPNTLMCWVYTDNVQSGYAGIAVYANGANWGLYLHTSSNTLDFYSAGDHNGSNLTNNTWYHVAVVSAAGGGGAKTVYLNGTSDISTTGNEPGTQNIYFGNSNANEWLDGRITGVKIWTAELTSQEINAEKNYLMPLRKANVWAAYPFLTLESGPFDLAGFGPTLTSNSTPSTAVGPALLYGRWQ